MLAFLHTATVHIAPFTRLVRELDAEVPLRHAVREDLLAQAIFDREVSEATRRETQAEVARLVDEGARVVLCTCSTLGNAAEATTAVGASVLRVDRPMAERAVELGRPLLLVAATPTAMTTAVALLREVGAPPARELLCSDAWRLFEASDQVGYARAIADQVHTHVHPNDVVMLAQASMAPAVSFIRSGVEVLTSPKLAVQSSLSRLRGGQRQALDA